MPKHIDPRPPPAKKDPSFILLSIAIGGSITCVVVFGLAFAWSQHQVDQDLAEFAQTSAPVKTGEHESFTAPLTMMPSAEPVEHQDPMSYPDAPMDDPGVSLMISRLVEQPSAPEADSPPLKGCGMLDLTLPQYQAQCAARNPPLTGKDCITFLVQAWESGDTTVSPDFATPDGCE